MRPWRIVSALVASVPAMILIALTVQIASDFRSPGTSVFPLQRVHWTVVAIRLIGSLLPLAIAAAIPIWVFVRAKWFSVGHRLAVTTLSAGLLVFAAVMVLVGTFATVSAGALALLTAASCLAAGRPWDGSA